MAFKGKEGRITFPIETPGDMTRLRFGCFYRARDAKDRWDLQVSFDEGKTFRSVGRAEGPKVFGAAWVTVADVPPGTRKALVRYAGQQRDGGLHLQLAHRRRLPRAARRLPPGEDHLRLGRGRPGAGATSTWPVSRRRRTRSRVRVGAGDEEHRAGVGRVR